MSKNKDLIHWREGEIVQERERMGKEGVREREKGKRMFPWGALPTSGIL